MEGFNILIRRCAVIVAFGLSFTSAKPIVDPGLFVIQGVTTCVNGTGYCMLGNDCTVDIDFIADSTGGHCDGLRDAFTPNIDFVCCQYNELGKASSTPETTTINSYTITDVFSIIDEHVAHNQEEEEIPEDFNPENVIDIVGVMTDMTGIVGLVTRPWTGTFPTKASTPTTTPMTPSTPVTTVAPASPATPADVDQITVEILTEETSTETPTEVTESYNEIPTEDDESSSEQQESQTTLQQQHQQEESSTIATANAPDEEDDIEIAHVEVMIDDSDDSTSTQSRPFSSPSSHASTTSTPIDHFDNNAIIFPDNPIVSKIPLFETEALESETESIVNANTLEHTVDINKVEGHLPESVSDSGNDVLKPSHSQQPHSSHSGVTGEQVPSSNLPNSPLVPSDDYDEYTDYDAEQLLLQPVNKNICGFKGFKNYINEAISSRVVGGVRATTVEWCWVVAIMERRRSGDKYVCTGALVESDLVITTATCIKRFASRNLADYLVVLGDSNLKEDLPYGIQFHRITEVAIHPDYLTSGGAHANDIGVLRLQDHATLSDNVCLVCMAQQDAIFPTQSCSVTGYGIGDVPKNMLRDVKDTVPSDGVLRQMSVPLLKPHTCRAALQNMTGSEILATSDSFICAGGMDGTNACYSTMDGGSPLACEVGGRWFLVGIVSYTRDCEKQSVPNVYTRVSSFSNWLQATHLRMMGFLTHQIRLT